MPRTPPLSERRRRTPPPPRNSACPRIPAFCGRPSWMPGPKRQARASSTRKCSNRFPETGSCSASRAARLAPEENGPDLKPGRELTAAITGKVSADDLAPGRVVRFAIQETQPRLVLHPTAAVQNRPPFAQALAVFSGRPGPGGRNRRGRPGPGRDRLAGSAAPRGPGPGPTPGGPLPGILRRPVRAPAPGCARARRQPPAPGRGCGQALFRGPAAGAGPAGSGQLPAGQAYRQPDAVARSHRGHAAVRPGVLGPEQHPAGALSLVVGKTRPAAASL